jgi:hypothetical protein
VADLRSVRYRNARRSLAYVEANEIDRPQATRRLGPAASSERRAESEIRLVRDRDVIVKQM